MKGEEKVNNFVPDCAHERWVVCKECNGTGKIELTEDRMVDLRRDEDRVSGRCWIPFFLPLLPRERRVHGEDMTVNEEEA